MCEELIELTMAYNPEKYRNKRRQTVYVNGHPYMNFPGGLPLYGSQEWMKYLEYERQKSTENGGDQKYYTKTIKEMEEKIKNNTVEESEYDREWIDDGTSNYYPGKYGGASPQFIYSEWGTCDMTVAGGLPLYGTPEWMEFLQYEGNKKGIELMERKVEIKYYERSEYASPLPEGFNINPRN